MKDHPPFFGLDFSALNTFRLVYQHRSFTAAAAELEVNQSAVSYTVDKLRSAFDDQLFFRQGGRLIATERCSEIIDPVIRMLDEIANLATTANFDPATTQYAFVIACNYYERQIIMPHIVRRIRQIAPGMRLETINSTVTGDQQLKSGQADLLIGPLRPEEAEFYCRTLLDEHYVCVLDRTNPVLKKELTRAAYLDCRHAVVNYGGGWRSGYLVDVEQLGARLNQVLSVPSPAGLDDMVAGTDLVTTLPSRIAERFKDRLAVVACPFPAPFQIDLVWTTRTHNAAMFVWLRDLIFREISSKIC